MALQVGELFAKLGLKDEEFTSKLNKAQSTLQAAGGSMAKPLGFMGNLLSTAGGFVAANVFGAIAGQFSDLTSAMVGGNAQFETIGVQFEAMLGSADAAKEHLATLADFAKSTPFEMDEVAQASRLLQVFGGAALNTEESLTLVGNAAAVAGRKYDEVAFWFGRAYDAIQAGKPFGEAAMNLQQMGVLSGVARSKVEALQEAGKSAPEVWAAFASSLNAPAGAMDKLSATFDGLKSTAQDNLGALGREAGKPLFELGKKILEAFNSGPIQARLMQLAQAISSGLSQAVAFGSAAAQKLASAWVMVQPALNAVGGAVSALMGLLGQLGGVAGGYGANIGVQFANGILSSITYVANAINAIATVVSYWLQPHSPPKALPELDQWGTAVGEIWGEGIGQADISGGIQALADQATAGFEGIAETVAGSAQETGQVIIDSLMSGWGDADFTMFNDLAGELKTSLKDLVDLGQLPEQDMIPKLLGGRDVIAKAVNEVDALGEVSEETLGAIRDMGGAAGDSLVNLVNAYGDAKAAAEEVYQAQAELNRVTEEYDSKLTPLNAQLKENQDKQDAIRDQQRLKKLQEESVDASKTAEERELARLEILEIQQRQQIKAVEDEKETKVDAAKAAVEAAEKKQKAAQDELSAQKSLIAAQHEQNALIAEQIKLLDRLAKEAEAKGKKGGGAGAGMPEMPKLPELPGAPKPVDGAQAAKDRYNAMKDRQAEEADSKGQGGKGAEVNGMIGQVMALGSMAEGLGGLPGILGMIGGALAGIGLVGAGVIPAIGGLFAGFAGLETIGGVIAMLMWGVAGAWGGMLTGAMALINPLTMIPTILSAMGGALTALLSPAVLIIAVAATLGAAWANNVGGLRDITMQTFGLIGQIIQSVMGEIVQFISTYGPGIVASFSAAFMAAQEVVAAVFGAIFTVINTILTAIVTFLWTNGPQIQAAFATAFTAIASIVQSVMGILQATIIPVITMIAGFIADHMTEIQLVFSAVWQMISAVVTTVLGVIAGVLKAVLAAIKGDWQGAWEGIRDALFAVLNGVKTFFSGWLDGLKALLNTAVDALAGVAKSLGLNIASGIASGIKSGASKLVEAAKEAAGAALQAAKDFLGIKSPSREAAGQIGEPFTQGIGVGILNGVAGLKTIVKNLSGDLLHNLEDLGKEVAEVLSGSIRDSLTGSVSMARQRIKDFEDIQALLGKVEDPGEGFNPEETARLKAEADAKRAKYTGIATDAQNGLNQAQAEAAEIAKFDAELGATYYKLRADQIMELAKLEKEVADAKTEQERALLQEKIRLTKQAQAAELALIQDQAKDSMQEFDGIKEKLEQAIKDAETTKRIDEYAKTQRKNASPVKQAELAAKIAKDQQVIDQLKASLEQMSGGGGSLGALIGSIIGPAMEKVLSGVTGNFAQSMSGQQTWAANPAQMTTKQYILNVNTTANTAAVIREFGVLEAMSQG